MKKGLVYIIGAGPGDPGLITVKGLDALRRAGVVLYDRLANESFLKECRPDAELIFVGKMPDRHPVPQEEINRLLVEKGLEGKIVARLKGGDPYIFGRGGEEAEALAEAGVPFEIVPGVTAAIAATAYAGIPATHRDCTSTVAFITGHEDPNKAETAVDWSRIGPAIGTIVIYMGIKHSEKNIQQILDSGRSADTPAALIQQGTLPSQRTVVTTLGGLSQAIRDHAIKPPTLIVIGEVVSMRDKLSWFENRPLFGARVLVTRSRTQASKLVNDLYALGASVTEFHSIKIEPPLDFAPLDAALRNAAEFDHIVFTSVNGVEFFFNRLRDLHLDIRELKGPRIWAIGPATRDELTARGITVEKLPMEFFAKALGEAMGKAVSGHKVLLPRADIAPPVLREDLEAAGAQVTEVTAYRTVLDESMPADAARAIETGEIDYLTFTSSSTVRNFFEKCKGLNLDKLKANARIISIGPVTTDTAREHGLTVHAEAEEFTIPGLVDALVKYHTETL
jgi:uroporphyrinogen III methyltransferase/synthase